MISTRSYAESLEMCRNEQRKGNSSFSPGDVLGRWMTSKSRRCGARCPREEPWLPIHASHHANQTGVGASRLVDYTQLAEFSLPRDILEAGR